MSEVSSVGLLTAFAAGMVSFLSPCVLPLVPGYVSYVAGQTLDGGANPTSRGRLSVLWLSACFVLGFSTVFMAFGASATALGRLLLGYRDVAGMVAGVVVIVFGLFVADVLRLSWLHRELRYHAPLKGGSPAAAYVLGLAFALGWTPCIGPVLGVILTVSAVSATVGQGIALLAVYSLGLGVPFMAAAVFTSNLLTRMRALRRVSRPLQVGTGAVMVVMGVAMLTGQLSAFSYWLIEAFPTLAAIG